LFGSHIGNLRLLTLRQRSITLVGEADRKVLKAAIKRAAGEDQVRHRTIPSEIVTKWSKKLESLKHEIAGVLREEKEEKQVRMRQSTEILLTDLVG
jgi:ATP-dependent RNA helicase DDX27